MNALNNSLKKWAVVLSIILVLSLAATGVTLAFLSAQTDPVVNQFEDAYVACRINRDGDVFDVTNTGNISAYIRATIVINWMDKDGNIRGIAPTDVDVTLELNTTDWMVLNDGYFYYTRSVSPDQNTNDLITAITLNTTAPEGYQLSVEMVAEAIQAEGVSSDNGLQAVLDAWSNN